MVAGPPGLPLAKRLSLRDGQRVWFHAMPDDIADEIDEYALDLTFVGSPSEGVDAAHVFVTERGELAHLLQDLRDGIASDGHVWVSWRGQGPAAVTEVTGDSIREIALPLGYVDTKACAVDQTWSGLKLVIRKDLR